MKCHLRLIYRSFRYFPISNYYPNIKSTISFCTNDIELLSMYWMLTGGLLTNVLCFPREKLLTFLSKGACLSFNIVWYINNYNEMYLCLVSQRCKSYPVIRITQQKSQYGISWRGLWNISGFFRGPWHLSSLGKAFWSNILREVYLLGFSIYRFLPSWQSLSLAWKDRCGAFMKEQLRPQKRVSELRHGRRNLHSNGHSRYSLGNNHHSSQKASETSQFDHWTSSVHLLLSLHKTTLQNDHWFNLQLDFWTRAERREKYCYIIPISSWVERHGKGMNDRTWRQTESVSHLTNPIHYLKGTEDGSFKFPFSSHWDLPILQNPLFSKYSRGKKESQRV